MNSILEYLPDMLVGKELEEIMSIYPEYDDNIRNERASVRLMELSNLYNIYIPTQMTSEIYSKLYLSLFVSMEKKESQNAIKQIYENEKCISGQEYRTMLGGINSSNSLTIIGTSGIGKSTTITRAIEMIGGNKIIETENPYSKIIPALVIQCPFDSSVKGMLIEILRVVDSLIGTKYYSNAIRYHSTVDTLIGTVSQACLQHVGLLIVDEIQHVVNSKNGRNLVGALTHLINSAGVGIVFVGTPECSVFFSQAQQLARRTLGLKYDVMEYGREFYKVCEKLFQYQYVKNKTHLTDGICNWLYEHSGANISVLVTLIHDAQELSILDGRESLDLNTLNDAYKKRLSTLHEYIMPKKLSSTSRIQKQLLELQETEMVEDDISLTALVKRAKNECLDTVSFLENYITVERVMI